MQSELKMKTTMKQNTATKSFAEILPAFAFIKSDRHNLKSLINTAWLFVAALIHSNDRHVPTTGTLCLRFLMSYRKDVSELCREINGKCVPGAGFEPILAVNYL